MNPIRKITLWGMLVNILLTACKFIIGFLAHSQACIADGVHSLSDFTTDIAVLVGVRFWSAPADSDHPHGHQRIEALITLFIGVLLCVTALSMAINSIKSIGHNNGTVPGWPVFAVALASIISKEILYHCTVAVGNACHSSALVASAWHQRSDAISSIPVAIVAVAGHFWPHVTYLDAVATVLVASMLLKTAWSIVWPCLKELSDEGVTPSELEAMRRIAASIPGIEDVHELRTRRLGHGILLDMHVLVDRNMSVEEGHRLCEEAATAIRHKMPVVLDVLTHLEPMNSVDLEAAIETIARAVNGVKDIHNVRVRSVLSGFDVDLHVLVEPTLSVAEGHSICNDVRDAVLKSDLKVVAVLTHLEPFYPKDEQN
ncbi:MAG: cation-efflux pump [Victivallales bacterium]|nr:cation-efflux pump [Victivallales bacterium]